MEKEVVEEEEEEEEEASALSRAKVLLSLSFSRSLVCFLVRACFSRLLPCVRLFLSLAPPMPTSRSSPLPPLLNSYLIHPHSHRAASSRI